MSTDAEVPALERVAGLTVPNPYRWLERDDDRTAAWQRAQNARADDHVHRDTDLAGARAAVVRHGYDRHTNALPRPVGDRWLRVVRAGRERVVLSDAPFGTGRVLFDLAEHPGLGEAAVVSWYSASPDGAVTALGICADGSERNTITLLDTATGRPRDDAPGQVLHDDFMGGVVWLPDSSGFFYYALVGAPELFDQRVFFHRLGEAPPTEPLDVPTAGAGGAFYTLVQVSADGRWAVAANRSQNPVPAGICDLAVGPHAWRPFMTGFDGFVAGHVVGDAYVGITDAGAPRGRIVSIPLDSPTPDDPATWTELLPEGDTVLRDVQVVGDRLYVLELVDTWSHVRVLELDGTAAGTVPLPARGVVATESFPLMNLVAGPVNRAGYLFAFSNLTEAGAVYRHRPDGDGLEELRPATVRLADATVDSQFATSADGTAIPYHVVRRADADTTAPLPTLVFAYGGFNVCCDPQFPSGGLAAVVEAGGAFVHAHLRGGGEYGKQWWDGGRLANKQNCYADLYAVVEDLIARGEATPSSLALTGESNGGLLAGVAVTQRPDLWRAVVPQIPFLDLVGALREPYGRGIVELEFAADPDDPAQLAALLGYSPYQLAGTAADYPAVYVKAGDTDPRCPAWHARKFVARLQESQRGSAPVLLRIWENSGHGFATEESVAQEQAAAVLAFLCHQIGLRLPADVAPRVAR